MKLKFSGPYSWIKRSEATPLRDADVGSKAGIYLWTVPTAEGELVYYVGETGRSFAQRMDEHLAQQLSGFYRLYEPDAFVRGEKQLLWRGTYGPGAEPNVEGFVERLPELAPALVQVVRLMRFHIAPTSCEDRLRKRIEAAMAIHFKRQDGIVGTFQDDDIRYSPRHSDEEPIEINLEWENRPMGVPDSVMV